MIFKKAKYIVIVLSLPLLLSCAQKVNLSHFQQVDTDNKMASHSLPDYVLKESKARIAILPPSSMTNLYPQCNLSNSAQESLVTTIGKIGGLDIVERSQIQSIMQETKFQASISGDIDMQQFQKIASDIDYVMVGSVASVGVNATFSEGRRWKDDKGQQRYTPPSCAEQGKVKITYRLVSPSGNVLKVFDMDGQKSSSGEVRYSSDCQVKNPCGVLGEAIYRAVDDNLEKFYEAFPSYGYIYKTQTNPKNPKERLAFISLGTSNNIKAGDKVDLINFSQEKNPVTGKDITNAETISECTILENDLQDKRSICMIAEATADKVKVKHAVKTKVNSSVFRSLQKGGRMMF
jgi:TolB-like protein